VTIAKRPSVGRDGGGYRSDLGQAGTEIFLQMGLDRANQIESFQEIAVLLISRRGGLEHSIVMAGLGPGHPCLSCLIEAKTWMARHKAGHDEPR
jgi:hypothetical protein